MSSPADLDAAFASFLTRAAEVFNNLDQLLALSARAMEEALAPVRDFAVLCANEAVIVAGLEARYFVRGAMGVPDEGALDLLVSAVLHGEDEELLFVSSANRCRLAAAAVRGYTSTHPQPAPETLAWYRQLGATRIEVGRAA